MFNKEKGQRRLNWKPLRVINTFAGWFVTLSTIMILTANRLWCPPFKIMQAIYIAIIAVSVSRTIYIAIITPTGWQPPIRWFIISAILPWIIIASWHVANLFKGHYQISNIIGFAICAFCAEYYLINAYHHYKGSKNPSI